MEVSLNDIDLEDETYLVRWGEAYGIRPGAIRGTAAINPPLLVVKPDGAGYQVVDGFGKVASLRALGSKTILARVMEPGSFEPVDLMEAVLREIQAQAPLDPVEVSRALVRLREMGASESDLRDRFLALMGLKTERSTLERYLSLDDLPDDITEAVSRGDIGIDSIDRVKRRFDGEEARRVLRLIRDLRLGVNRQREVIVLLAEITRRDRVTVSKILGGEEIAPILADAESNLPQSGRLLVAALRRIRSPETMAFLDEVKARIRDLALDPAVTLELSPYLEEKLVRVAFTFRTPDEFRRLVEKLDALGNAGAIERLVDDLFGGEEREKR